MKQDRLYSSSRHLSPWQAQFDIITSTEFFFAYPASAKINNTFRTDKIKPIVITFESDNVTFGELLSEYRHRLIEQGDQKQYYFSFPDRESNYYLNSGDTVRDLKKRRRIQWIQGQRLFLQMDSSDCSDQNAILDYFERERLREFEFFFSIQGYPHSFTIHIDPDETGLLLKQKIVELLNQQFEGEFTLDCFNNFIIKDSIEIVLTDESLDKQPEVVNRCSIELIPKESLQLKFIRRNMNPNKKLIIYKLDGVTHQTFLFDEIKFMTVDAFYNHIIQKDRSQYQKKMMLPYLKIMQKIILPNQSLFTIDHLYENVRERDFFTLVGYFISEKMALYKAIEDNFPNLQLFTIDSIIFHPEEDQNRKKKKSWRERINQKAIKSKIQYFRIEENIDAIMLYTDESSYFIKEQNNIFQCIIYKAINILMRQHKFVQNFILDKIKKWAKKYICTLNKHLLNLSHRQQWVVYRGINGYEIRKKVGDYQLFKGFTSTSIKYQVAEGFCIRDLIEDKMHVTMFEMKIKQGSPLEEYSIYSEDEILLNSGTLFKITEITTKEIKYQNKVTQIKYVKMEEVEYTATLPDAHSNIIIWVDDQFKQIDYFNSQPAEYKSSTLLIHLTSTQQLKEWLEKNSYIFEDKQSKMVFLTDMTRKQNGVLNYYAGIDGLLLMKEKRKDIPALFYVGDVQRSQMNLKERGIIDAAVADNNQQILRFLMKHLNIIFPSELFKDHPKVENPEKCSCNLI